MSGRFSADRAAPNGWLSSSPPTLGKRRAEHGCRQTQRRPSGCKGQRTIQPTETHKEQTLSTATITPTIEKNEVHNYRTAELSDVLGHEVCGAIHGLKTARAMAHALAEALPDNPVSRVNHSSRIVSD